MLLRVISSVVLLALSSCEGGTPFASEVWKRDGGRGYESARVSMLKDIRDRYPKGSNQSDVLAALGPSETFIPDICAEQPTVDACAFYFVGASGPDPVVFVIGFRDGKVVTHWKRSF